LKVAIFRRGLITDYSEFDFTDNFMQNIRRQLFPAQGQI